MHKGLAAFLNLAGSLALPLALLLVAAPASPAGVSGAAFAGQAGTQAGPPTAPPPEVGTPEPSSARQGAGPAAGPGGPRRPMPKPVNLQVLPKTMTGAEVMQVMHRFEGQLGVECGFCHAPDPATDRLNFPSDAKPEKATARLMLRMTADINEKYLTQINDPDHADHPAPPVTCGTCHRGKSMPAAFAPVPSAGHHDDGPGMNHDDHPDPPPA